jgi:hypothetical protein
MDRLYSIRQIIGMVKNPIIRQEMLDNETHKISYYDWDEQKYNPCDDNEWCMNVFVWERTRQGHTYWSSLVNTYKDLVNIHQSQIPGVYLDIEDDIHIPSKSNKGNIITF